MPTLVGCTVSQSAYPDVPKGADCHRVCIFVLYVHGVLRDGASGNRQVDCVGNLSEVEESIESSGGASGDIAHDIDRAVCPDAIACAGKSGRSAA